VTDVLEEIPAPPGGRISRARGRLRAVSGRTSLRTKLVAAVLALVLFALAAAGLVGVSLLRGYVLNPYDSTLEQYANFGGTQGCIVSYLRGITQGCGVSGVNIYLLTSSGQLDTVSTLASSGDGGEAQPASPPDVAGAVSWLSANTWHKMTVPAQSGSTRWRVMAYPGPEFSITTNPALQSSTVILAVNASDAYDTIARFTRVELLIGVVVLVGMAVIGFAVVQANLRPLVEIEETAEEIAEGHLNRRVPERDPRTEIGSLGRSLNTMLTQIESAFHDREKSEAAAHQSEERMRRFIADASHELRTPLTAIRGFAEYYRQRGGLNPRTDAEQSLTAADLDRIMHRVEAEAARMGLLVEDLLMLARVDQQRPLARNPVDLLSLAADAVHDTRMLAPDRKISLTVQPGAAFLVIGDEPRLRQVIGNLMSNALTHTPDGTEVELSVGSGMLPDDGGQAVTLAVRDYGPGMEPEQASRVFERFYRADQARTRATGGSGLGLAIVAGLVAAHGGVTSVDTAPGEGATFWVTLPLAPEAQGWDPDDDVD
jgi:two-component system, OmpR family, sensor kinase